MSQTLDQPQKRYTLTVDDVRRISGVSNPRTIYRWVRQGWLPAIKVDPLPGYGGHPQHRFNADDLTAFLQQHDVKRYQRFRR
jgi:hypothetical protein